MKRVWFILVTFLLFVSCAPSTPQPIATPTLNPYDERSGPFLGEAFPGAEPIPFGRGFFKGSFHSAPVFSPEGNTVWWAGEYRSATIYTSRIQDGVWTAPASIQFSENIKSYRDPFISPDGNKFYFISTAALPGTVSSGKENIWMMEKRDEDWSEPQPLPESINALNLHWTHSVAQNYNLYFSADNGDGSDIYISRYANGNYSDPIPIGTPINSDVLEFTPNIAPDESYLLFTRVADHNSTPYLYISYATTSGWSEPVKIENVLSCISPIITPDRNYVIYLGSPSSFEWRDTSFIEELKPN